MIQIKHFFFVAEEACAIFSGLLWSKGAEPFENEHRKRMDQCRQMLIQMRHF